MDKFEYELKVEQIEKLISREDYSTAKKIADTMEWKREKDSKLLARVAELYAQAGDIEKAMKIYNFAYNASTRGLLILERMTELALIFGQLDLAEELCEEYRSAGAYDADYYLFKFQIADSRGEGLDKRIAYLEQYCSRELDEEALYRLAWLYDRAGREQDCVRICDYIIDFFCFGESVENAIVLKQNHAPLTKYQERRVTDAARYEQNYQRYMESLEDENRRERKEKQHEEQIREDALMETQENALGKQVSEIVKQNELEKQEVNLDALVAEEQLMAELSFSETAGTASEEQPEALTAKSTVTEPVQEPDSRSAGEIAEIEEAQENAGEQETAAVPEIMEEAECETVKADTETKAAGELQAEPVEETVEEPVTEENGETVGEIPEVKEIQENAGEPEVVVSEITEESEPETNEEEAVLEEAGEVIERSAEADSVEISALEQALSQAVEEQLQEELSSAEDVFVTDVSEEKGTMETLFDEIGTLDAVTEEEPEAQEKEEAEEEAAQDTPAAEEAEEPEEPEEAEPDQRLEMRTHRKTPRRTSELSALDLVVPEGSFKVACSDTELGVKYALELVRMVPEDERCEHVAKISGRQMNKAAFSHIEQQLDNDILMITNAGQMTNGALESIYTWMKKSMDNRVILVDNQNQLDILEKRKPKLMKRFTSAYAYEKKDTEEWLELVGSYADENDCVLDDEAYQLFEEYLRDKEEKGDVVLGVNLKEALQDALHQATKFSLGNMMSSILNTKYDEDGLLILKDRHFL